jgi:translation initiation factor 3 subunit G
LSIIFIQHSESTEESDLNKKKAALIGKKILCRICKGDHFTTKCPFKDIHQPLDELGKDLEASKDVGKFALI